MASAANLDGVLGDSPVDVILMDIYLGAGKDGVAATRDLAEKWPEVKVAVISASLDARVPAASKRAGADLFLSKSLPVADMVSAIRRLASSTSNRSPNGDKRAGRTGRTGGAKGRIGGLSPRERQVLEQVRLGRTNREIAARLGISIGTVNKHVHEVLTVLKVRNRTQAAGAAGEDARD